MTSILFSVPAPDPSPLLETFKKKDVIEILSHKKAYNACKYNSPSLLFNILSKCSFKLFCDVLNFVTYPFSHPDCTSEAISWRVASGADEHVH